jgi:protein-tyrosine phosphatase
VKAPTLLGLVFVAGVLSGGCVAPSKPFAAAEVSPGVFVGSKPVKQADFDALRACGVRTILNLEQLPWDTWPEGRKARRNGFQYRDVPIMASPLQPRERRVKDALRTLSDPALRPIFVHCLLGKDRTAFVIGLYRVYYQDWTPEAAWEDMLHLGFHVRWTLRGFDTYFWHHTQKPAWAKAPGGRPNSKPP